MSDSLRSHGLYSLWNSPCQNTGVGSHSFLQGIFPNQGLNPGLPHCRQILYQLSYQGSPRILERVVNPFSSGSSRSRNWTGVSCIAGGFLTCWATSEALFFCWGVFCCMNIPHFVYPYSSWLIFSFLAVMSQTTINLLVHVIWYIYTFFSLKCVLRVELLGYGGRYDFTFVKNC